MNEFSSGLNSDWEFQRSQCRQSQRNQMTTLYKPMNIVIYRLLTKGPHQENGWISPSSLSRGKKPSKAVTIGKSLFLYVTQSLPLAQISNKSLNLKNKNAKNTLTIPATHWYTSNQG